jgi:hypothetical protein
MVSRIPDFKYINLMGLAIVIFIHLISSVSNFEAYYLLGCDAVQSGISLSTFQSNPLSPFMEEE